MSEANATNSSDLTAAFARREQLLEAFEAAWRRGERPAIEAYLPGGAAEPELLLEFLQTDLEQRLKAGEPARAEEYLGRYPEVARKPDLVLALMRHEYHLRRGREAGLKLADYAARLLQIRAEIARSSSPAAKPGAAPPGEAAPLPPDAPAREGQGDGLSTLAPGAAGPAAYPAIAGYEILAELGRGAMGVVYQARQVRLNRLVAIKMILSGEHARPEDLVRFLAEAEAVAQIQHPHIVQIYEVSQHAGLPFFVLEYVAGGNLAQRLQEQALPASEAAALVAQLAGAVHAAHQQGIIHRDLKPANVLLDQQGRPKVTDFGLAKRVEGGRGLTQTGAVMGTPSYMAPEQAEGKSRPIGPAADVYALGAILYELLTGRPPFKAATPLETVMQVVSDDPVSPSRLQPKLSRDLVTICLKCLRKEPRKRYLTAADLADDLHRFLAGDPIKARPIRAWERAVKWAKRRPAVAGLLGLLLVVVTGGFLGMAGLWLRAEEQRQLAEQAKVEAERERDRAKKRFQMAREAVDQSITQVSDNPELKAHGLEGLRMKLLKSALDFYEKFVQEEGDNLDVQAERGRACLRLAALHRATDQIDNAERAFQQALAIQKPLADVYRQEPKYQQDLANTHHALADLYWDTKRIEQAGDGFQKALALRKGLVDRHPGESGYRQELANSHRAMCGWYREHGRNEQAKTKIKKAQEILQELADNHPGEPKYQQDLAWSYSELGILAPDPREQMAASAKTLTILRQLVAAHADVAEYRMDLANACNNIGNDYKSLFRLREAEEAYQESLAILKKLAEADPQRVEYQSAWGWRYIVLAKWFAETGEDEKARQAFDKGLEIQQQLARANPQVPSYWRDVANTFWSIGDWHRDNGRFDKSLEAYEKARAILEPLVRAQPKIALLQSDLADSHRNRGLIYQDLKDFDKAKMAYREALSLFEQLAKDQPGILTYQFLWARAANDLGDIYRCAGQRAEATASYQQVLQLLEPIAQQYPSESAYQRALAAALARTGQHIRASNEIEAWASKVPRTGTNLYGKACVYALAAFGARQDAQLPAAERDKLTDHYAAHAVVLLAHAKEAGYFKLWANVAAVKRDRDLDALRSRSDFQKLLNDLEAKTP